MTAAPAATMMIDRPRDQAEPRPADPVPADQDPALLPSDVWLG